MVKHRVDDRLILEAILFVGRDQKPFTEEDVYQMYKKLLLAESRPIQ